MTINARNSTSGAQIDFRGLSKSRQMTTIKYFVLFSGISMHKGFAFVQFTGPFDARSACLGEDGRTICGQVIDVNMVGEPKPHQQGKGGNTKAQKRPREESPADE
jgi:hypothetical protein